MKGRRILRRASTDTLAVRCARRAIPADAVSASRAQGTIGELHLLTGLARVCTVAPAVGA